MAALQAGKVCPAAIVQKSSGKTSGGAGRCTTVNTPGIPAEKPAGGGTGNERNMLYRSVHYPENLKISKQIQGQNSRPCICFVPPPAGFSAGRLFTRPQNRTVVSLDTVLPVRYSYMGALTDVAYPSSDEGNS
jgi:hypothetical protein